MKALNKHMFSVSAIQDILDMTCVCNRSNTRSDWLILGHYAPVMPGQGQITGLQRQTKSHIIKNLLTSNVRSLRENLNLGLAVLASLSLGQYDKVSIRDFLCKHLPFA